MESKEYTRSLEVWLSWCGSVLPLAGGTAEHQTPNAPLPGVIPRTTVLQVQVCDVSEFTVKVWYFSTIIKMNRVILTWQILTFSEAQESNESQENTKNQHFV